MVHQENALEQEKVRNFLHVKERQFVKAISSEPYYRIIAVPTTLNPDAVDTQAQEIQDILRNPPNVRRTGFGFIGVKKIESSSQGVKGIDVWDYEMVVLKSGFLELRRPLFSPQFQHFTENSGISADSNWLHPYAVCELPVTFMRLV